MRFLSIWTPPLKILTLPRYENSIWDSLKVLMFLKIFKKIRILEFFWCPSTKGFARIWSMTTGNSAFDKAAQRLAQVKPPSAEPYYKYVVVALIALATADLAILGFRPHMLPSESPPQLAKKTRRLSDRSDVGAVISRNIFNSDGKIPPSLSQKKNKTEFQPDAPAVASNLPLKLEGTLVHIDAKKSIASILLKAKSKTLPFRVEDEIEGLAVVTKIERRKVTFRNTRTNHLEYIEIPKEQKFSFGAAKNSGGSANGDQLVRSSGDYKWEVNRTDVTRLTQNLQGLLKLARVEPNRGPGGQIEGFRFQWIKPDSPFEKLGFKVGDVIMGVDGEPINDPRSAMEAYQAFKNSSEVRLDIVRNGKRETFTYSVNE